MRRAIKLHDQASLVAFFNSLRLSAAPPMVRDDDYQFFEVGERVQLNRDGSFSPCPEPEPDESRGSATVSSVDYSTGELTLDASPLGVSQVFPNDDYYRGTMTVGCR